MDRQTLREIAETNWELEDLYKALGQAKRIYKQTEKSENITPNDRDNLHGILAGKKAAEIAKIYGKNYGQTRNELSDRLYKYLKVLLNYDSSVDIESIDIPQELAARGFRKQSNKHQRETEKVWWRIVIEIDNPDNLQLQAIVKRLGEVIEKPLIVQKIEAGSTLLAFESERSEYERIEQLYRTERLDRLLQVTVSDLGEIPQSSVLIYMRQIYQNIFGEGYQPVALILTRNQRSRSRTSHTENLEVVERAKSIELGGERSVNLAIQLIPQAEDIDIKILIYPSGDAAYLPAGLQVTLLDESGEIVPEYHKQVGSKDNALLLAFSAEPGEKFSVRLVLGSTCVTEHF